MTEALGLCSPRRVDMLRRDELISTDNGKLAANPDSHVIAVLAVIADLLLLLSVVRALNGAGVDLECFPAVLVLAEAFAKTPVGTSGIPKSYPDDFCVRVGECAFSVVPDRVVDAGRLIKDHH